MESWPLRLPNHCVWPQKTGSNQDQWEEIVKPWNSKVPFLAKK